MKTYEELQVLGRRYYSQVKRLKALLLLLVAFNVITLAFLIAPKIELPTSDMVVAQEIINETVEQPVPLEPIEDLK